MISVSGLSKANTDLYIISHLKVRSASLFPADAGGDANYVSLTLLAGLRVEENIESLHEGCTS